MNTPALSCQNCKNHFTIEQEDFAFYEKFKLPPPTFCRECRLIRRMTFRNERTLYRRACNAPGHTEEVISVFSPDNPQNVYDHKAWWGDGWDGVEYGRNVDFSRPFLVQIAELWREVPDIAILNINPVNSEYCSVTEGNKNCYLVVGGDFNEDTMYSAFIFNSTSCVDTYWVTKSDFNYETVDCLQCSQLRYSRYCEGCYDSAFLFNCRNCHDCFGCVNLSNKQYCIFNQQYTKEEYFEKLKEINLGSYTAIEQVKKRFQEFSLKYPRRFARLLHAINSTGDNLEETKNCSMAFDVFGGAQDCNYIWLAYSSVSDCFDCDHFGQKSENSCEVSTIYPGSCVFYSRFIFSSHDVFYSYNCHNSSYLFGCVGLRNKQYCILNKQYTKEEYEALIPRIIEHMNTMPFVDSHGRSHRYGEFFPIELSPFAYNESIAQEYYPVDHQTAQTQGYRWQTPIEKSYTTTKVAQDIPDALSDISDEICNEIIECMHAGTCKEQCTTAFKVTPQEFAFYKQMNIPLPRLCSNCRHYQRLAQRNPLKLWHRQCNCAGMNSQSGEYKNDGQHAHGQEQCTSEFETTYAPDRPEIVYCEQCYQAEVV